MRLRFQVHTPIVLSLLQVAILLSDSSWRVFFPMAVIPITVQQRRPSKKCKLSIEHTTISERSDPQAPLFFSFWIYNFSFLLISGSQLLFSVRPIGSARLPKMSEKRCLHSQKMRPTRAFSLTCCLIFLLDVPTLPPGAEIGAEAFCCTMLSFRSTDLAICPPVPNYFRFVRKACEARAASQSPMLTVITIN
jgi:hypothetical protein